MFTFLMNWIYKEETKASLLFKDLVSNLETHYGEYLIDLTTIAVVVAASTILPVPIAAVGATRLTLVLAALEQSLLKSGMPYLENLTRATVEAVVHKQNQSKTLVESQDAFTRMPMNSASAATNEIITLITAGVRALGVTPSSIVV